MTNRAGRLAFALVGAVVAGTLDIAYACISWAVKAGVPARRNLPVRGSRPVGIVAIPACAVRFSLRWL